MLRDVRNLTENFERHSKFAERVGVAAPNQPRRVRRGVAAASSSRRACLEGAADLRWFLDLARLLWYSRRMNTSVRNSNRKHMTRFGWAVGGVVR
jgi:hypothetical protein